MYLILCEAHRTALDGMRLPGILRGLKASVKFPG